jgi:hypothetical protein
MHGDWCSGLTECCDFGLKWLDTREALIDPDPRQRVQNLTQTNSPPRKDRSMLKTVFEKYDATEVTDDMLAEAAQLFNEYYGIWGTDAAKMGSFAKPRGLS